MPEVATRRRQPAVEGFFTWPSDAPALIASRCKGCGTHAFPYFATCINPACRHREIEKVELSRRGILWTYTVHHYRPPPPFTCPEPFTPFAIGMVELPEGLKVMGMMTGCNLQQLRIGMAMELVVEGIDEDDTGTELLTWKFSPCRESSHA